MGEFNKGDVILINGIPESGKTTLALKLKFFLENEKKRKVYVIDGNFSRSFFDNDLGYSEEERFKAFKRNIFGAYLLANQGINVILAINMNGEKFRNLIKTKLDFIEILLDADVNDCIKNDSKGVYKKYMKLDKPNIPGLDIPFQKPENPDLILYPYKETPEESLQKIIQFLEKREKPIRKVVYSATIGDLFHYGHLQALKFASSLGDYYICGVITNEAAKIYRREPIANLDERKAVIEHLKFVDRVMIQNSKDSLENLKKIHEEFKDAKIVLVRSETWKDFPEKEFIEEINGEIITHPYYEGLSDFKIVNYMLKNYKGKFKDFEDFTNYFKVKDFIEFGDKKFRPTIISTKANTLKSLQPLLKNSIIEKTFFFTVSDWNKKKEELLNAIKDNFSSYKIAVRSSALVEDTSYSSMAGCFHTELNVSSNDVGHVENAIEKVINSYSDSNDDLNQVLIQKQTSDIKLSGVLFTRTLENSPYYVVNYDDCTGFSNTVTKGLENKNIKISKFCNPKDYPHDLYKLLIAVKEIEEIVPNLPLDIEFAINDKNQVIIFQVRPLVRKQIMEDEPDDEQLENKINEIKNKFSFLSRRQPHLAGDFTYFGDMPDWNPAEIIGNNPNFLDFSLYDYIITDSAWHEARTSQGYYNVNPAKLVVLFGNKPYINVRNTFNSFIPSNLSFVLREKLLKFYLDKLRKNPELQDKVEFDILYTCYDLSFDEKSKELLEEGFTKEEILQLKNSLINLTNELLINSDKLIQEDIDYVYKMETLRESIESLNLQNESPKFMVEKAINLLDDCRKNGTVQFSRLARLAFMGKIILKSILMKGIIDKKSYNLFLESINTVAKSMSKDFSLLLEGKIAKEDFLKKYGHLRPGTYDITSLRYDKNEKLFGNTSILDISKEESKFYFENDFLEKINNVLLQDGNIKYSAENLLNFIKKALEAREFSKFEFTKNLSYALELIAEAGEKLGFSRNDISNLDMESLIKIKNLDEEEIRELWKNKIKSCKKEKKLNSFIVLPPIIFSKEDFDIITYYTAKPNFITQKKVMGDLINLDSVGENEKYDLKNKIVVLENGDPGYDWIFTKGISGLITKYGGVASHMAIRCSEFGIPAAIGCGDLIFDKLSTSKKVNLNCETGRVEVL